MSHIIKNRKYLLFLIAIALLVGNIFVGLSSNAYAEPSADGCRMSQYTMNGKICYDCYTWTQPPYWGCIGCPWTTC